MSGTRERGSFFPTFVIFSDFCDFRFVLGQFTCFQVISVNNKGPGQCFGCGPGLSDHSAAADRRCCLKRGILQIHQALERFLRRNNSFERVSAISDVEFWSGPPDPESLPHSAARLFSVLQGKVTVQDVTFRFIVQFLPPQISFPTNPAAALQVLLFAAVQGKAISQYGHFLRPAAS